MRRPAAAAMIGAVLVAGYATLDVLDRAPGIFTLAPVADPVSASPAPSPTVSVAAPSAAPSGMPLAPAGEAAPVPSAAALQAAVAPALTSPALRGTVSAVVRDATTNAHLLDDDADTAVAPASVLKLLSATAVDSAFAPGSTLTTSAVLDPGAAHVFLVAGGDTLLAPGAGDPQAVPGRAGLADLATQAAAALKTAGVTTVTVSVDSSYASGPATAPTWPAAYRARGLTGPVAAIGLSTQRAVPGKPGPADPVAEAGRAFVARLREQQVTATFDPASGAAPQGARPLGAVASAPVADVLALALVESDNALTESLARQAAFRSGAGSDFAATAAYVRSVLVGLGVDVSGVATYDASGLTRQSAVPARVVADVLALGTAGRVQGLKDTLRQLPVAGLTGTLADRFDVSESQSGAGVARAKTGTLTGVNTLAGTVVTLDGRLLTFTVMHEGPGGTPAARGALDRFVAALAQCGCR